MLRIADSNSVTKGYFLISLFALIQYRTFKKNFLKRILIIYYNNVYFYKMNYKLNEFFI